MLKMLKECCVVVSGHSRIVKVGDKLNEKQVEQVEYLIKHGLAERIGSDGKAVETPAPAMEGKATKAEKNKAVEPEHDK
jgi:hypothetical protein